MRTLARTLIILIAFYAVIFPLGVGYTKARRLVFPHSYRILVRDAATQHDLDPLFVAALIYTESSFKPKAVSKSGAIGLMQIMPDTALQLAKEKGLVHFKMEELFDPKTNLEMGCTYLSKLSHEFDDSHHVLVAYNAGRSNLIRWLGEGDLLAQTFPETRKYVIKVRGVYWFLKLLHKVHGFF